uniref:Macaca fascicularis brain cDNA clone: QflA-22241, similar to human dexamethasone-induced transcript (DEXI), mRNA, RefSeq: NM_014015.3 n=1 Tax=Macaca fascicularis TaxID=9541 RepID=I7G795_MACFA|nr:unnamed protein product [Macaca fascicularis]
MDGEPSSPKSHPTGRAKVQAALGRNMALPTHADPGDLQTETMSRIPTDTLTRLVAGASRTAAQRTRGPSSKMTTWRILKMQRTGPSGEGAPHAKISLLASGASGKSGSPWACGDPRRSPTCWQVSGQADPNCVLGTRVALWAAGPLSSPTRTPPITPMRSGRRPPKAATSASGGSGGKAPGLSLTPR